MLKIVCPKVSKFFGKIFFPIVCNRQIILAKALFPVILVITRVSLNILPEIVPIQVTVCHSDLYRKNVYNLLNHPVFKKRPIYDSKVGSPKCLISISISFDHKSPVILSYCFRARAENQVWKDHQVLGRSRCIQQQQLLINN